MRRAVAIGCLELAAFGGGIVITMTWPTLAPEFGYPLLFLCALLAVAGLVLLILPFTLRSIRINRTSRIAGDEYVSLNDAGLWLYDHASPRFKEWLRTSVPDPFESLAEYGAAFYRTAWTQGRCKLYGRREVGLSMEEIDPKDGEFSAFETIFGSDRRKVLDLSVKRRDLQPVLDHYERDEPLPAATGVKRDAPLSEAAAFISSGRWGRSYANYVMAGGKGDVLKDIEQAARDGTITVWGKARNDGVWDPIPATYWSDHYLDVMALIAGEGKSKAVSFRQPEPLYDALMVSRAEFTREFAKRASGDE